MAPNCDYYRDRAIVEGMDSQAAREWRNHSRRCHACSTEIQILDSLCEQAMGCRQHIPRRDFYALAETVRQLYQPAPTPSWGANIWNLSWKIAAALAFLAVGYQLLEPLQETYRQLESRQKQTENISFSPAVSIPAEPFAETFSVGADQGCHLAGPGPADAPRETEFSEYDYLFAPPGHYELEDDLRTLRQSVSGQIDSLEWLIDCELNGEF